MIAGDGHSGFAGDFDALWSRLRRVQIGYAVGRVVLLLTLGLALLTAADYRLELEWHARAAACGALGILCLALTGWTLIAGRRWSRRRMALEIERQFPQLGQSVRTAVQFGNRQEHAIRGEGVAPALAWALDDATQRQAAPLGIGGIVPARRLYLTACAAAATLAALSAASVADQEWNLAARRALLQNLSYTELAVSPGDTTVDQGANVSLALELHGRTDRRVVISTRADRPDAAWVDRELSAADLESSGTGWARYQVTLPKLQEPTAYRLTADHVASPVHQIHLRLPLNIRELKVELSPPSYTGLVAQTVAEGDLRVIDGTTARFRITLDRKPAKAWLALTEPGPGLAKQQAGRDEIVPLAQDGTLLTAELLLTADRVYSIVAEAADGPRLPPNSYRIRVRRDQPPQIWFESPGESLEVHPLAEVLLRVRARDDFGLSRAGIVFQINNEEEHTLVAGQFPAAGPNLLPQTGATLEKVLPLEHFLLTQKDCVGYFAFVEDNAPGLSRRVETELRFIDLRPFKRVYRYLDPESDPAADTGKPSATLEELIHRQREALNRTLRLAKRPDASKPDLGALDGLIDFQSGLAAATGALAERLEGLGIDGNDLLFQAETAMLSAIDSLSAGKYENASLQQRDALRYLIEGRSLIEVFLLKRNDPSLLAELRRLDRIEAQKLRKPKNDAEQAAAAARKLRELADREAAVGQSLGGTPDDGAAQARDAAEKSQSQIVADAYELTGTLKDVPGLSELAQSRMQDAVKKAEQVSGALARGATPEAAENARAAAGEFRELARQVEGLLEAELTRQIALARDLSQELAQRERQLGEPFSADPLPAEKNLAPGFARLAETGRTLEDLLQAATHRGDGGDAASKVEELMKETDLAKTVERLRGQSPAAAPTPEARAEALDLAERFEAVAERLDALHGALVAPRLAELLALESQATELRNSLGALETEQQITEWHRQTAQLLARLGELSAAAAAREELLAAMQTSGAGKAGGKYAWPLDRTQHYIVPEQYLAASESLVREMHRNIQELILGDLSETGEEAAPPQYKRLVERYYQILSQDPKPIP